MYGRNVTTKCINKLFLKRHNSFQIKKNRKATLSFVTKALTF